MGSGRYCVIPKSNLLPTNGRAYRFLSFNWPDQRLMRSNRRITTEGNSFSVILKGFILYILKNKKEYKTSFKFTLYIILATIPSIIVGIFIKPLIEKVFNDLSIIAIGFLLTSLLLLYENKRKTNSNYTFLNTFSVGVFQSLALFPGLSRSGTTMFAAKLAKLDDTQGKRLSFFLLIPISLGSTILSIFDYNFNNLNNITLYGVGFIVTFIMTFISLKLFINKYNNKHNIYFSYYLIILSYIILLTTI